MDIFKTGTATEERVAMMRLFPKSDNAHEVQKQWEDHFDMTPRAIYTLLSVNRRFHEPETVEKLPRTGSSTTVLSPWRYSIFNVCFVTF
jgi:hypothetical protein